MMDIHPPEQPIMSLREFFVHLGTVTIGILIALSLEGLLEWNHHQHLIREARENIRTEIEDNRRELSKSLQTLSRTRQGHGQILRWISEMEKQHKSGINSLTVNFTRADLKTSSWTTAQTIGALSLMSYAEVKRDAAVYQLQEEFLRLQTAAEDSAIAAMSLFQGETQDPSKAGMTDLEA